MKYIIMCGGWACKCKLPKHLYKYKGKPIVQRTVDLLRKYGIEDIAITTSPSAVDKFESIGVEVISYEADHHPFIWLEAFYPIYEPVCYIFGDVIFSDKAIKTIVKTETKDIEFFASAPPFANNYPKTYAEPFAFKVADPQRFHRCVAQAKTFYDNHVWYRLPIAWELWQVIKGTAPNKIIYDNYTVINDFTCDIDTYEDIKRKRR